MKKRIRPVALSLVAGVCAALSFTCADAQQLYKWVDKNGRVQYSDRPPPDDVKKVETKRFGDNRIQTDAIPFSVQLVAKEHPVVLYTNACGTICTDAHSLLAKRGIPFTLRDPSDPAVLKDMQQRFGAAEVPSLQIGERNFRGFAAATWTDALSAVGYPTSLPDRGQTAPPPKAAPPKEAPAKPANSTNAANVGQVRDK